jgi:hypothetical protein
MDTIAPVPTAPRPTWLLVAYRAPREPSTERVAVWRALKRMGALYIAQSTCVLTAQLADEKALRQIGDRLRGAGGVFDVMGIEAFDDATEAHIRTRFNADRDAEYGELIERADAILAELEVEAGRRKFTFAEVEENESGLAKLRTWLATIRGRDLFNAGLGSEAGQRMEEAEKALAAFTERAATQDESIGETGAPPPDLVQRKRGIHT